MSSVLLTGLGVKSDATPSWLHDARSTAVAQLQATGLPNAKTEAWRFTSVRSLLKVPFATTTVDSALATACVEWAQGVLCQDDSYHRVFVVNGTPVGLSTPPEGLSIESLSTALVENPKSIERDLTRLAPSHHFGALNDACFVDGVSVRISGSKRLLQIVHISAASNTASVCYPRLLIVAEANSECTVVENYLSYPNDESEQLCTAVTEVRLEDGAIVDHLRIVESHDSANHVGTLAVEQDRNSNYQARSVILGGKLSRLETYVRMVGAGATCQLDGVYHAVGSEHVAHYATITHAADHCSSNTEYRGLIDDRAHAVFDGIVVVDRGTKATSAHQQNHNLLLSETASVNTKPHLEIDSDDLEASHGATVGALDADHLFFLRARGIGEDQARAMLTFSFVRSIVDRVQSEAMRQRLLLLLLKRLPNGEDLKELIA